MNSNGTYIIIRRPSDGAFFNKEGTKLATNMFMLPIREIHYVSSFFDESGWHKYAIEFADNAVEMNRYTYCSGKRPDATFEAKLAKLDLEVDDQEETVEEPSKKSKSSKKSKHSD